MSVALVIETDPAGDPRRLGEWLVEAGLEITVVRTHTGAAVPEDPSGYAALVALGRDRSPAAGGTGPAAPDPGAPDPAGASPDRAMAALLRRAVRDRVPTLAVGRAAHLLATAHGGAVAAAEAGPGLGPALIARRDVAGTDPLFARVPFAPDVIGWHRREIVDLPAGAVLLAASTRYPHQAFRVGPAAWGLQFQIGTDPEQLADWAAADPELVAGSGWDPAALVAAAAAVADDLAETWQPFVARFAALARGELAGAGRPDLPLLGGDA